MERQLRQLPNLRENGIEHNCTVTIYCNLGGQVWSEEGQRIVSRRAHDFLEEQSVESAARSWMTANKRFLWGMHNRSCQALGNHEVHLTIEDDLGVTHQFKLPNK